LISFLFFFYSPFLLSFLLPLLPFSLRKIGKGGEPFILSLLLSPCPLSPPPLLSSFFCRNKGKPIIPFPRIERQRGFLFFSPPFSYFLVGCSPPLPSLKRVKTGGWCFPLFFLHSPSLLLLSQRASEELRSSHWAFFILSPPLFLLSLFPDGARGGEGRGKRGPPLLFFLFSFFPLPASSLRG